MATPGVRIKVSTRGVDQAQRRLRAIGKFTDNMQPIWKQIGDELIDNAHQRFRTSIGPGGKRWLPTKAGNKPLIRTGALMRSIHTTVSRRKMTIGSGLPYAAIHQFGGMAGRGHRVRIPARPYLADESGALDSKDRNAIERITVDFIRRKALQNA